MEKETTKIKPYKQGRRKEEKTSDDGKYGQIKSTWSKIKEKVNLLGGWMLGARGYKQDESQDPKSIEKSVY